LLTEKRRRREKGKIFIPICLISAIKMMYSMCLDRLNELGTGQIINWSWSEPMIFLILYYRVTS
jgi:hypothetical protein